MINFVAFNQNPRRDRRMMTRLVFIAAVLAGAGSASAQSFDCAKARTRVEKMVCGDRGLAELDEYLGRYYPAARTVVAAASACLQADQAAWLKSRRDACADVECLKSAYLERLAELDPLQPGATALKNVVLPRVPSLVWIIPPAADKAAAPPNPAAKPFEATGTIVNDVGSNPESEGVSLRTTDGNTIPLVMLMFLESPTQDHLTVLAKEGNAVFRARGHLASDSRGRTFFEPSRCVFLHRIPSAR